MYLVQACATLLGLASLAASAPTVNGRELQPAERGLKWTSRSQKRSPLAIIQEVQETNIVVVEENLGQIAQLQQLAEQEFAALLQAQLALVTEIETIKNNIRINHFKARFSQVNTVIITVTTLVDSRSNNGNNNNNNNNNKGGKKNNRRDSGNRYLINQLLADNGKPDQAQVIMVSDAATMTINNAAASVAINGASVLSAPTGSATLTGFDQNAPFGQLNQSVILPAGAQAPQVQQVFADPAAIILPNQNNLFVEDAGAFLSDCVQQTAFFQVQQAAQIFQSFEQLAAAQAGAVIVNGVPAAQVIAPAAVPAAAPAQDPAAAQASADAAAAAAAPTTTTTVTAAAAATDAPADQPVAAPTIAAAPAA